MCAKRVLQKDWYMLKSDDDILFEEVDDQLEKKAAELSDLEILDPMRSVYNHMVTCQDCKNKYLSWVKQFHDHLGAEEDCSK